MSGTKAGAQKAKITNLKRYGKDFHARIGAIGGSRKVSKGFGKNHDLAVEAGKKGGTLSKRGKAKNE